MKPGPSAELAEKERFIKDKWSARSFAQQLPKEAAQELLWKGIQGGDIRCALRPPLAPHAAPPQGYLRPLPWALMPLISQGASVSYP